VTYENDTVKSKTDDTSDGDVSEDVDDSEDMNDDEAPAEDDEEKDDNDSIQDFGYDGKHIEDYGEMVVSIVSSTIYLKLTKNSRTHLLSYLGKVSSGDLSIMGNVVEDLFWNDLQKKNIRMKCWKAGNNVDVFTEVMFEPTTILTDKTFDDLPKIVFGNGRLFVCRMTDRVKVIDFGASPFCVIQVTVSPPENHDNKLSGIKSLLLATGFLEYDSTGSIVLTNKTIEEKIKFY
jgi:hypothetical protein